MVTVSEAGESRKKGIELHVRGANDNHRWAHITKHYLREVLHICESEVLNAVENQGGSMLENNHKERKSN